MLEMHLKGIVDRNSLLKIEIMIKIVVIVLFNSVELGGITIVTSPTSMAFILEDLMNLMLMG